MGCCSSFLVEVCSAQAPLVGLGLTNEPEPKVDPGRLSLHRRFRCRSPHDQRAVLRTLLRHPCRARGALASGQGNFVYHWTKDPSFGEWRFSGTLGFGGKFYFDGVEARISCYPEDRTEKRDQVVAKVNELLQGLMVEVEKSRAPISNSPG